MGADMVLACAVLKKGEEPDFERARAYIGELREGDGGEGEVDLEQVPYLGAESLEEAKAELREALSEFEQAVTGMHRQVTTVHPDSGDAIYLTGGLSWGDAPTELFATMETLAHCGVLEAAGFSL